MCRVSTEDVCGSYVNDFRFLAVNAETKNYDIDVEFLKDILGEEVERDLGISGVRRDILTPENVM